MKNTTTSNRKHVNALVKKLSLDTATGKTQKKIAIQLMEMMETEAVTKNIEKFPPSMHPEIAKELINHGGSEELVRYLEKFQGLDHQDIALDILEDLCSYNTRRKEYGPGVYVAEYLEKFQLSDYREVALKMIKSGYKLSFVKNIEKFKGINHQEMAQALLEDSSRQYIMDDESSFLFVLADYLDMFKGLDKEFKKQVLKERKASY